MTEFTTIDSAELALMRAKLKAADDLAMAFEEAIVELESCTDEFMGEDYNNPDFNAALAAYRNLVPETKP